MREQKEASHPHRLTGGPGAARGKGRQCFNIQDKFTGVLLLMESRGLVVVKIYSVLLDTLPLSLDPGVRVVGRQQ